jgi:hypothetical protein
VNFHRHISPARNRKSSEREQKMKRNESRAALGVWKLLFALYNYVKNQKEGIFDFDVFLHSHLLPAPAAFCFYPPRPGPFLTTTSNSPAPSRTLNVHKTAPPPRPLRATHKDLFSLSERSAHLRRESTPPTSSEIGQPELKFGKLNQLACLGKRK